MSSHLSSEQAGDRIRYYLDENVDQRIIVPLRQKGIIVTPVEDVGLKGEQDDRVHLQRARELGCVLVTHDPDFGPISKAIAGGWTENPEVWHAGIVFVTSQRSPGKLIGQLEDIYKARRPEEMINLFWPI